MLYGARMSRCREGRLTAIGLQAPTRRWALVRLTLSIASLAACLACLAAPGAAHATPLVRLYEISSSLAPRDGAIVAVRVTHRSVCALTLARQGRHVGPYRAIVSARYGVWTWRVPSRARGGSWTSSVRCRGAHQTRRLHSTIRVQAPAIHTGGIVAPGGMSIAVSNRPPGGRTTNGRQSALLGGKGGGDPCVGDPKQPGSVLDAGGYCTGNCTHYVWTRRPDLTYLGDAGDWRANAARRGIPSGSQPVVGAIAWWSRAASPKYGHVAYVQSVSGDTFTVKEMNHAGYNIVTQRTFTIGQRGAPTGFLYGGPAAGAEYIGHIVQWDGDTKAQKTAWLVVNPNGHVKRNWIPDIATYSCLKNRGAPGPDVLSAAVLSNELPDETGVWATCAGKGGDSGSATPAPAPTPAPQPAPQPQPPPPPPPPPAQRWAEQETPNHSVNTFTNYHNASGVGPAIAAGQWVQVSCKVYDPTIQSVNPDGYWYRIASSPWNNAYYAPANTFMNGDPYGGPYTHNTDFAVPNC